MPVQVLGELFNVLVRKGGKSRNDARNALLSWRDTFPVVETSPRTLLAAADLATDHELGLWDAVILAAAAQSGCRLLLSENPQNGFTWAGVTVVDPFAEPQHALLQALLEADWVISGMPVEAEASPQAGTTSVNGVTRLQPKRLVGFNFHL